MKFEFLKYGIKMIWLDIVEAAKLYFKILLFALPVAFFALLGYSFF